MEWNWVRWICEWELELEYFMGSFFKTQQRIITLANQNRDLMVGDCTSVKSSCTTDEIAMFLLGVEKGAFLM